MIPGGHLRPQKIQFGVWLMPWRSTVWCPGKVWGDYSKQDLKELGVIFKGKNMLASHVAGSDGLQESLATRLKTRCCSRKSGSLNFSPRGLTHLSSRVEMRNMVNESGRCWRS